MITYVRKSTPMDALRIMYNITPLHLHIREWAMNTYYRVRKYNWIPRIPNLGSSNNTLQLTLFGNIVYIPSKKTSMIGHEAYTRKMIPITLQDKEVDKVPHRYVWNKPYTSEIGNGTIPPELWSYGPYKEEPDSPEGETDNWQIFTDGSLMEERSGSGIIMFQAQSGVAFSPVRYSNHYTSSVRLKEATVYQSEVKAVQIAAELALKMKRGPCKCNIWLDNQAGIYELGKHEITQKCVLDAHKALINLCIDVTTCDIRWVRGHSGALGNELADEAAKLGSKSNRGNTVIPTAASTIKRLIHEKINILWPREWMSNQDWCRQTKYFYKKSRQRENKSPAKVWQRSNIQVCEVPHRPSLLKKA